MLINLSIENVAVIEKATVDFSDGFNILTGETGAGKSLLIDSLSMVLGMRTSRDLIRSGADYAFVTALFSACPDMSEFDIAPEDDGSILLSRKLYSDGRNICKINGVPSPMSVLKAVGERLVTIHGQHDNIALLKPSFHLAILDEYAKNGDIYQEYLNAYKSFIAENEKLEKLKSLESEKEMLKDTLSFRINEINAVAPCPGEDELLIEKRDALRNYSSVMTALSSVSSSLSDSGRAKDSLYGAMCGMNTAAGMDKSLTGFSEKLADLYYSTEDIASEIKSFMSKMSFSPFELEETEERLDSITHLKKKYGPDLDSVINNQKKWSLELEELISFDDNILALNESVIKCREQMLKVGEKLHQTRLLKSKQLSDSIEKELAFLDMPKVSFHVRFTEHEADIKGLYDAEFMISTNPSERPKPLSRIASGGEMSRIMLSLKSALADCDDVNVLLFDEIDAGVSGRAALKIAEKLKALAKNRQIICITHLPQMAAKAHNHLLILKDTSKDSFTTHVTTLDRLGRIDELTRLISGGENSSAARLAAEEMLDND